MPGTGRRQLALEHKNTAETVNRAGSGNTPGAALSA